MKENVFQKEQTVSNSIFRAHPNSLNDYFLKYKSVIKITIYLYPVCVCVFYV